MRHHLVVLVDVRRPKIDEDVDDEHDVDDEIDDGEGFLVVCTVWGGAWRVGVGGGRRRVGVRAGFVFLFEDEGSIVGGDDGGVDDQEQNDPVPDRLERGVVKDRPPVYPWRLELVLWQNIRP